jgi:glycosyltransferase involved in cell wall biosynthesis
MPSGVALSIVHPWDPWKQAIGGFDTCLDGILRTLPAGWHVELIGCSADVDARPVGRWLNLEVAGRPTRFFAALSDAAPNRVSALPLSLRFAAACRRRGVRASGRIVQYHRFESGMGVPARDHQHSVYFFHNHPPEETRSTHNNVRWRHLRGLHLAMLIGRLRRASLVVAVDPRTPSWLEARLPDLRGRILPLMQWADPSVFNLGTAEGRTQSATRLREGLGLPAGCKIVLLAGRLEPQKDPLLLVEAFAKVAQAMPDVYLLIVGEGELRQAVKTAARALGVDDRTRLMSSVSRGDLAPLYRACDVDACSSAFEAGPRTSFEALACGTPVVSFDVGQIGPVLERDSRVGVLVRQRDSVGFAAALAQVLARPFDPESPVHCAAAVREHTPERSLVDLLRRYQEWEEGAVVEANPSVPRQPEN